MKKLLIFGLILSVRVYSDFEEIQGITSNQFVMFEFSETQTPIVSKSGLKLFSVEL